MRLPYAWPQLYWAMAAPLISSAVWLKSTTIKACLPLMNYWHEDSCKKRVADASSPTIAYVLGPTPKQARSGDGSFIAGRSRPYKRHRPLLLNWLSMRWRQDFLTRLLV